MNYKRLAIPCMVLVLFSGGAGIARTHKARLPDPKLDSNNLFSSPDAAADVTATFVTTAGKPIAATRSPRLPEFQLIRQLPSLTPEQRRQVDVLERELNIRISALRDSAAALQQKLDAAKAHPDEKVVVQGSALPSSDRLKSEISDLNRQVDERRQEALSSLFAVLTDAQRKQYSDMKHGMLVISGDDKLDRGSR